MTHPITPPPELVLDWCKQWTCVLEGTIHQHLATKAARWGADQELEACCEQLRRWGVQGIDRFRAARRPKPPSLKEQALAILDDCSDRLDSAHENTIRRALEQLND